MSDKDAIKQLQEKVKKVLRWQERVKEEAASAATETETRERQEPTP